MTGTGALALRDDQQDWTEAQRAALEQLGVAEAPRGDQLVFLHVSQRMGLDPFNKEIYMIGRWDPELGRKKWTIQVGIDGFRSKAEEHPKFAGVGATEWCGSDGQWTDVWLADEPPKAARFTVRRSDQSEPVRAVALYKEYVQKKKGGDPTQRWLTAPAAQLGKCAQALTLRTAFPRQLGGVYVHEELDHLDNPQPPPVVIESERVEPVEPDWDALTGEHEAARDLVKLGDLWKLARGLRPNDTGLLDRIAAAAERVKATFAADAAPPTGAGTDTQQPPPQRAAAAKPKPVSRVRMSKLTALLAEGRATTTEARLRLVSHALGRDVTDFADLTAAEVEELIGRLEQLKTEGRLGRPAPEDTPAEQPEQTAETGGDQP